jgi:hypothetical protein
MSIWTQIAADVDKLIAGNPTSITIRRDGGTPPGAQTVRIERMGTQSQERSSAGAQQAVGRVLVLGKTDLDIRAGDRFNDANGVLHEVVFVRPNRLACVQAEARAVE